MNKIETSVRMPLADNSVDLLQGWDTVYAIRYADVNSAIVKAGSSPADFDQAISDEMLAMVMPENGDWAVSTGGAGHIVKMTLPVPIVTLDRPGHDDQTRANVVYEITEMLAPMQRKGAKGDGGGDLYDLKIDAPGAGAPHTITVQSCTYEGSDTDPITQTFLIGIMTAWLNENAAEFDHTFATVNLNAKAAHDKFDWLMPTATSYAVNDQGSIETGIFGVLCMTESRDPSKNQQIMTEVLPDEERSSFLISRERFLSKMLLPGLGVMFTGPQKLEPGKIWPNDYFHLTDNDTALTNRVPLYIDDFNVGKEGEDTLVRAELGASRITAKLEETYLNVRLQDLTHPYYKVLGDWWLKVHHTIESRNSARLNPNQVFDLIPLSDEIGQQTAQHDINVTKTEWAKVITWAEIIIGLAALAFPLARAGWLRYTAAPLEVGAGGAVAGGEIIVEGVVQEAQATEMAASGASGALAFIRNGLSRIGSWLLSSFQTWHGQIAWAMTALLTFEQIRQFVLVIGARAVTFHFVAFACFGVDRGRFFFTATKE